MEMANKRRFLELFKNVRPIDMYIINGLTACMKEALKERKKVTDVTRRVSAIEKQQQGQRQDHHGRTGRQSTKR